MYCRYENKGYCELNKKECVPTSKGCIIKNADNITLISKVQRSSAKDKITIQLDIRNRINNFSLFKSF